MSSLIGLIIVFGAVLGGFVMAGGPLGVLIQPNELVVIGGATLGTLVISAPGKVRGRVIAALKLGFKNESPTRQDYLELLKMLYQVLNLVRREGVLALESHLLDPKASTLFQAYPSLTKRHHAMDFMVDGLKQMVDGCSPEELALLFDADLETHHDEAHQPLGLIRMTGDALPGLGIVAAVLGIVITMGHLNGGPEEIGHHIAAALVGTFLGILLCYGLVSPLVSAAEMQTTATARYLSCIKEAIVAAARGVNPAVAIEFARRAIFSDERPGTTELEQAFAELKGK